MRLPNRCDYVRFSIRLVLGVGAFYRIRGEMEFCFVQITAHFFSTGHTSSIDTFLFSTQSHTHMSPYNDANQSFVLFWFILLLRLEISSLSPTFIVDFALSFVFQTSKHSLIYTRSHSYYIVGFGLFSPPPLHSVRRIYVRVYKSVRTILVCSLFGCYFACFASPLSVFCVRLFVLRPERSAEIPANRGRNCMKPEFRIHIRCGNRNVFSDLAVWLCASHASPFIARARAHTHLTRFDRRSPQPHHSPTSNAMESRHLSLSM